jgi:hypothetical protein
MMIHPLLIILILGSNLIQQPCILDDYGSNYEEGYASPELDNADTTTVVVPTHQREDQPAATDGKLTGRCNKLFNSEIISIVFLQSHLN